MYLPSEERLPNAIVVGAPRSGTTSLYAYLSQHPDIYVTPRKELHYFTYELILRSVDGPGDRETALKQCATKAEYLSQFAGASDQKVILEVSPSYLYFSQVAAQIRRELGNVKIIAILRNPVDKVYSQYMHMVSLGLEKLDFESALDAESQRKASGWGDMWKYTQSSYYAEHISDYIGVFGSDNVKVLISEELFSEPTRTLVNLFEFLGIDDQVHIDSSEIHNKSGVPRSGAVSHLLRKPPALRRILPSSLRSTLRRNLRRINLARKREMNSRLKEQLEDLFAQDIHALESIIGRDTGWVE